MLWYLWGFLITALTLIIFSVNQLEWKTRPKDHWIVIAVSLVTAVFWPISVPVIFLLRVML